MVNKTEVRDYRAVLKVEGRKLVGRAASFGVRSHTLWDPSLGDFTEILEPGCFARSLGGDRPSGLEDVIAHYNHDTDTILGRTSSSTLRLWESSEGLEFEIDLPDTQLGRDLAVLVERGDLSGCSFGMMVQDKWTDISESMPVRHITDVDLLEISIVQRPAYPQTEVALRSLEAARKREERDRSIRSLKAFLEFAEVEFNA